MGYELNDVRELADLEKQILKYSIIQNISNANVKRTLLKTLKQNSEPKTVFFYFKDPEM